MRWPLLLLLATTAKAQSQGFQFSFAGSDLTNALSECASVELTLTSSPDVPASPPYSFFIYEGNTTPRVQTIDAGRNSLSNVTIQARAASSVMLTMSDANGASGGISAVYFVQRKSSILLCGNQANL